MAPAIADALGAALFSGGLALGIGALAQGKGFSPLPAGALLAGPCIRAFAGRWQVRTAGAAGHALAEAWRGRVMPRLLGGHLPRPMAAGEIAVLGTDHIAAVRAYGERFVAARLGAVIGPLLVMAMVASVSWVAALILAATMTAFVFGMVLAGTAAARASDRQLASLSALSAIFVDRVAHLPLIRHFRAEDRLARQVGAATGEVAARTLAVLRVAFLSSAVLEFAAALAVALVAVYCGFGLLGLLPFRAPEHPTLAKAFFVLAMAPEFYLPMRRLAAAYHEKQLGEAAMRALSEVEGEERPAMEGEMPAWSGLVVRDLALDWPGTSIGPLSFDLGPAGLIALTGPTGAGKTSVLGAIAGLISPTGGTILGPNGRRVAPALMAVSAQQPLLLAGTLAANIALARPDAAAAEIRAVADRVGLGPAIAAREAGLDTVLDHRGSGLSGGERKRIGLARALLSGRPLLLLDEPTADLDAGSARAIVALIVELARERPVIVATHDPGLIAVADREVML